MDARRALIRCRLIGFVCLAAYLGTASASPEASASGFVAAELGDAALVALRGMDIAPIEDGERHVMRCATLVRGDGSHRSVRCYAVGEEEAPNETFLFVLPIPADTRRVTEELSHEILRALTGVRLRGARIDGEPRQVRFAFSVMLVKDDGHTRLVVVPNHGFEAGKLGIGYRAAQREHATQPRCYGRRNRRSTRIVARVNVDERGRPGGDVELFGVPSAQCAALLEQWLLERRFVPAADEAGVPVASRHVELLAPFRGR